MPNILQIGMFKCTSVLLESSISTGETVSQTRIKDKSNFGSIVTGDGFLNVGIGALLNQDSDSMDNISRNGANINNSPQF